MYRISLNTRQI